GARSRAPLAGRRCGDCSLAALPSAVAARALASSSLLWSTPPDPPMAAPRKSAASAMTQKAVFGLRATHANRRPRRGGCMSAGGKSGAPRARWTCAGRTRSRRGAGGRTRRPRSRGYDVRTADADPPRLLRTWIRSEFVTNPRWSENLPPPLFVSSNMKLPALEKTLRIAFGFVLVALIVSRPCFHVAVWIATLSGAAGGPGVSVIVVVRVMSNHFAVIVTVVFALTGEVVTGKALLALPLLM